MEGLLVLEEDRLVPLDQGKDLLEVLEKDLLEEQLLEEEQQL